MAKLYFSHEQIPISFHEFWIKITILILSSSNLNQNIIYSIVFNISKCIETTLFEHSLLLINKLIENSVLSVDYEDAFLEMISSHSSFDYSEIAFMTLLNILQKSSRL